MKSSKSIPRNEYNSQSSYVEMNPPLATNQSSSADSYMVMENKFQQKASKGNSKVTRPYPRRISRRKSDDEPIFHLEGLQGINISEEESKVQPNTSQRSPISSCDLDKDKSTLERRKYKQKGNKHKDDYCFVDLGFEDTKLPGSRPRSSSKSSTEVKKRSGSFSFSNNRKWKSITFNKQK